MHTSTKSISSSENPAFRGNEGDGSFRDASRFQNSACKVEIKNKGQNARKDIEMWTEVCESGSLPMLQ